MKLDDILTAALGEMKSRGRLKGAERVVTGYEPAGGGEGPRWRLRGEEGRSFLRMNSNSYLGLSLDPDVIAAGEDAARRYGAGPGAVRFISGTTLPHVDLEERLASFHGREAGMLFSAAYAAVMGVLPPLVTDRTVVLSDELNHNCIINALRLSRPMSKVIYPHLSLTELEKGLRANAGKAARAIVVTDGIFSMRGDHAPLDAIAGLRDRWSEEYKEGCVLIVDDSHGIGAFGESGRGTEEHSGGRADILVATLGKALGVNGGYAVSSSTVIGFLRETSPFYVYSNPVTPSEASAALKALEIVDSRRGGELLKKLRTLSARLGDGLERLGFKTIRGGHPIVPLITGDAARTSALVDYLFGKGILATGITFPVVPAGADEVRFQVSASHTEMDVDYLLKVIEDFGTQED